LSSPIQTSVILTINPVIPNINHVILNVTLVILNAVKDLSLDSHYRHPKRHPCHPERPLVILNAVKDLSLTCSIPS